MVSSLLYYNAFTSWIAYLARRHEQGLIEAGSWQAQWLEEGSRAEMQTLIVALLTIATWLIVTYATPPEDYRVLETFFRKVRPGGPGWQPIRQRNGCRGGPASGDVDRGVHSWRDDDLPDDTVGGLATVWPLPPGCLGIVRSGPMRRRHLRVVKAHRVGQDRFLELALMLAR